MRSVSTCVGEVVCFWGNGSLWVFLVSMSGINKAGFALDVVLLEFEIDNSNGTFYNEVFIK